MSDLTPVIAATTHWLVRAYPGAGRALAAALAEVQAHQAVTVACWLRYPTSTDVALLVLTGPGGAGRLDAIAGTDLGGTDGDEPWRSWVDEVVASWAACLLGEPTLAAAAVAAAAGTPHAVGAVDFRRLVHPGVREQSAGVLLRHPDLLAPVADLHRAALVDLLEAGSEAA